MNPFHTFNTSRLRAFLPDFILLAFCLFLITYRITDFPVRIWDESIYANNAIEMWHDGNILELQNNGVPNYFNIKPPLAVWLQALSVSAFGINTFAIRLPTILFSFGLLILLLLFCKQATGENITGRAAILSLSLMIGFVREHVARTGDLDAMLLFFSCGAIFSLLMIKVSPPEIKKYLFLTWLCVLLGFFTKSVSIFLILPALFVLTLLSRETRKIYITPKVYQLLFFLLLAIFSYWTLMDFLTPGFFEKVFRTEVSRGFLPVMTWLDRPWYFYIELAWRRGHFNVFIYALPVMVFLGLRSKESNIRFLTLASLMFILAYSLTIAYPPNKLEWYDAPIYPFFAILTGIGIRELYQVIINQGKLVRLMAGITAIAAVSFLVKKHVQYLDKQVSVVNFLEEEGTFINNLLERNLLPEKSAVVMQKDFSAHYHQLNFYRKKALWEREKTIDHYEYTYQAREGDTLIICSQGKIDSIREKFSTTYLEDDATCHLLTISKAKETE